MWGTAAAEVQIVGECSSAIEAISEQCDLSPLVLQSGRYEPFAEAGRLRFP